MSSITFPVPNISSLSSFDLERYVAAIFQANDYLVKRDLWWSEPLAGHAGYVDILQADILASSFSSFAEGKILVECKGGGVFTDLFKFIGIVGLIKPNSALFIANNPPLFDELRNVGTSQNVTVLRPTDIISTFSTANIKDKILHWYWANEAHDYLLNRDKLYFALGVTSFTSEQNACYSEIRKYNTLVASKIWTMPDPRNQANLIFSHLDNNKGFILKNVGILKMKKMDMENAMMNSVLCDAAASVVLRAKLEYIVVAVRCAIGILTSADTSYLSRISDANFKTVVQKMVDNIHIACRLPYFLQFWIYQLGGLINTNGREISIIAKMLNEREESVIKQIKFLNELFSILTGAGSISWALTDRTGIYEVKGVPDSIRGYGMVFRELNNIDTSAFVYKVQWIKRTKDITGY